LAPNRSSITVGSVPPLLPPLPDDARVPVNADGNGAPPDVVNDGSLGRVSLFRNRSTNRNKSYSINTIDHPLIIYGL
jgi:hypothetical protein